MPKFSANLSTMYKEVPFDQRFSAAAKDGFQAVECQFPYELQIAWLRSLLNTNSLQMAMFNAPPGNWEQGERGLAAQPGREDEFKRSFDLALEYARSLNVKKIHIMAGLRNSEFDYAHQHAVYLGNLAYAALLASREDVAVMIEPLNPRDMPGYFLNSMTTAREIIAELDIGPLQLQFDIYHCQILHGDIATRLRACLQEGIVGHIQIASVPERQEPDQGEIHYPYLFDLIDELGYAGYVGCEYHPRGSTSIGLGWMKNSR